MKTLGLITLILLYAVTASGQTVTGGQVGTTGAAGATGATGPTGPNTTILSFANYGFQDDNPIQVNQNVNSLTDRIVGYFLLPYVITANQISVQFTTTTTPGTMELCIYTANGATKMIDVVVTPSANAVLSAAVSAVAFTPGAYYVIAGCATTCNVQLRGVGAPPFLASGTPSGKTPWFGTVTHASGGCDTTLGTVTATNVAGPLFRIDN